VPLAVQTAPPLPWAGRRQFAAQLQTEQASRGSWRLQSNGRSKPWLTGSLASAERKLPLSKNWRIEDVRMARVGRRRQVGNLQEARSHQQSRAVVVWVRRNSGELWGSDELEHVRAARGFGLQRLAEIAGLKELWRGHGLPPKRLPCATRRLRRRRRSSAHIKALFWSGPRPKHCSRWLGQATVGLSYISSSIFLFTDIGNWAQYGCQMGAGLLAV
jgi:hypothetical protein